MGKRSNFERNPRDYYPTPYEAVEPLLQHLIAPTSARGYKPSFVEPCAGDGRLVRHLSKHGLRCNYACDIEPQPSGPVKISKRDVLFFDGPFPSADFIITNPPWDRDILHRMIDIFRVQTPTWLLFDAGWAHTSQSIPLRKFCHKIVSVGRVKWIENSPMTSLDDCAWYLFKSSQNKGYVEFYGP